MPYLQYNRYKYLETASSKSYTKHPIAELVSLRAIRVLAGLIVSTVWNILVDQISNEREKCNQDIPLESCVSSILEIVVVVVVDGGDGGRENEVEEYNWQWEN